MKDNNKLYCDTSVSCTLTKAYVLIGSRSNDLDVCLSINVNKQQLNVTVITAITHNIYIYIYIYTSLYILTGSSERAIAGILN